MSRVAKPSTSVARPSPHKNSERPSGSSNDNVQLRFAALARKWKRERNGFSSDPVQWAMCLSYQKIIAIGPPAIPLILTELEREPDHWFWALHALTDANPIKANHRGRFNLMVQDWLRWGSDSGY